MYWNQFAAALACATLISGTLALADEMSNAVDAARAPVTKWPGPASSVEPEKGMTVYVITCASQGIGCVRAAKGVEEAGAALGWTVRTIDGQGDPATWNKGIQSAIAAKANGIVLAAVPPMLVGDALESCFSKGRRCFGVQSVADQQGQCLCLRATCPYRSGQAGRRLGGCRFQGQGQSHSCFGQGLS